MRALFVTLSLLLLGAPVAGEDRYALARRYLVEQEISPYVGDRRVLAAMSKVPREEFLPLYARPLAYRNSPLPIGEGQTISQPIVVAMMSEALSLGGDERVLEVGTGSGYQAAILAELAKEVYTIEIVDSLAKSAEENLVRVGYRNVRVRSGDGYAGWPEKAPFDAIIITAAAPRIPEPLIAQLAVGGRLVLPIVREGRQFLEVHTKRESGTTSKSLGEVRFVPMTGAVRREGRATQ